MFCTYIQKFCSAACEKIYSVNSDREIIFLTLVRTHLGLPLAVLSTVAALLPRVFGLQLIMGLVVGQLT